MLNVQLQEIRLTEQLTLSLVTSLSEPAMLLSDLYRHRGDIEIDIRNFKVVLNAEENRARSEAMFYKELWASLVSYNLVIQFRRQAAALLGEPPRRLSFKRTWTTFREFLLHGRGILARAIPQGAAICDARQTSEPARPFV